MSETEENPDRPQGPKQHLSARVPDNVVPGVFATGAIVMTARHEFVVDFVQGLIRPYRVAARVILPHAVFPRFIEALKTNLDLYCKNFGEPPELPGHQHQARANSDAGGSGAAPQSTPKPSAQQIYDDLKISDETLSGRYASGVMITHGPSEFAFDFITNFIPNSAVSCRVFLPAPQAPRLLKSLSTTFRQFEEQVRRRQQGEFDGGGDADDDEQDASEEED